MTTCAAGTRCRILDRSFICEYGDIDYRVTVPWDYIVAGSGELLNPSEVLTGAQRDAARAGRHQRRHGDDPHAGRGR